MNNLKRLAIRMDEASRSNWNFILQKGFFVHGQEGMTVREFLFSRFGYDSDFIDNSVRTIFLNRSPVDGIDKVYVKDGDRLALGGAMPGLVGIVMGRDNPFKSFRKDIASKDGTADEAKGVSIRVFAKVFSTLAVESGEEILSRGIEIPGAYLQSVLEDHAAVYQDGGGAVEMPGDKEMVMVTVEFGSL
ncbi:hypothetical protein GM415_12830 [Pseudodesulfovibrio cashew]|uniref:Uncharacterized protein n=1 Tax=Pseudodesulfovibrio cashew TaxID=2678688 RepID=A0A6I6JL23_9BACT|nr:hypothetical protein [Pseudodesulfovibrio cashew]QGY40973.1 hypothetical protein GM415_12830 [Pseudodesulfovibrio cashew]